MTEQIFFTPGEMEAVRRIADQQTRRWEYVEAEELRQDLYLMLCKEYKWVKAYRQDPYGPQKLSRMIANKAVVYCKKMTEDTLGYKLDDANQIVTKKNIGEILKFVWTGYTPDDTGYRQATDTQTWQGDHNELWEHTIIKPSEAHSQTEQQQLAHLLIIDIIKYYNECNDNEQTVLQAKHRDGKSVAEISADTGLTEAQVRKLVTSGEQKLWRKLAKKYQGSVDY